MRKALIVDDAGTVVSVLKTIFRQEGIEVAGVAGNGNEAVVAYRRSRPDFVTMDLLMPEMDGLEAMRMILEEDPMAKILICTALGDSIRNEAIAAGASGFLSKPFLPADVMNELGRVFDETPEKRPGSMQKIMKHLKWIVQG